ncbi:MAG: nucleoside recognition domain-containing protein [Limnochordia bacterium]|jgi:ferrous iron transport protein B
MDSTSSLHSVIEDLEDLRQREGEQIREAIVSTIYQQAETIAQKVVQRTEKPAKDWDGMIDDVVTSRALGIPLMLLLLGGVFWLTIVGSNYPSQILNHILFTIEDYLSTLVLALGAPPWFHGLAILGVYRGLAWVVSVMLPPMAIFFPLFTLFEDLGYLPRIAFNLDGTFKRVGAHGKQALTMAMGFGCNAAGIIAARIIDSPRERLIAILTNNFVPCNGRFPILISMAAIIAGLGTTNGGALTATIMIVGIIMAGVAMTFFVSWGLSRPSLRVSPLPSPWSCPPIGNPKSYG